MLSNDYPVAGQASLMIAMDTTADELRAVSNSNGSIQIHELIAFTNVIAFTNEIFLQPHLMKVSICIVP
jgi:hypothetical protein